MQDKPEYQYKKKIQDPLKHLSIWLFAKGGSFISVTL